MVFKLKHASESSGELVKTQIIGPPQHFKFSGYGVKIPEFALKTSSRVILMMLAHTLRTTKLSPNF